MHSWFGPAQLLGFEYHDNDIIPFNASAAQHNQIVAQHQESVGRLGHQGDDGDHKHLLPPHFQGRCVHEQRPRRPRFATQKVMHSIDTGAKAGVRVFVFWGGRKGVEVDASKCPVEAAKWFREAINFLCNYVLSQGYDLKFSIEPKPNEPRGDLYLPTVGSVLAFIGTLDHPEMCGINPETAHIKMAGLNPSTNSRKHGFGEAVGCPFERPEAAAFDQDLSFGSDDLKEAFFTTKLLMDHKYGGTIGFNAHPYPDRGRSVGLR